MCLGGGLAESRPWHGRTPTRYGLLEEAATEGGSAKRHPRLIRQSPAQVPPRPSSSKGPTPMMYDLTLPVIVAAAGTVVLAVVYVMSKDPGRRIRAWQLLKLLLRR
jgi:hypothetical protein